LQRYVSWHLLNSISDCVCLCNFLTTITAEVSSGSVCLMTQLKGKLTWKWQLSRCLFLSVNKRNSTLPMYPAYLLQLQLWRSVWTR